MSNRRKFTKSKDWNFPLPEGLSDLLIEEVMALPSCPKSEYLKSHLLTKYVSSDTDPAHVTRQRAINKWLATERENEATNHRLLTVNSDFQILPRTETESFFSFCREFIRRIIGDTVPVEALIGAFSGGASTSRMRTESHPASKYLGKAHITSDAIPWWELALEEMPLWSSFCADLHLEVVAGNVMFTVPKTTDIDRCACKEPDINMFLQKGAGNFIRSALKKFGINLNDQSRNQELAREGSITGLLATLDLSSASDSISTVLVQELLPPAWFDYLNSIRSRVTEIDGEEHVNEMFSSMGNGFTFELESLLFFTIAKAVAYFTGTRGTISVYGDDIIVPTECAHDLIFVLSFLGFSTNVQKSCIDGPLRESCGGHFTNGLRITPFYVRKPITRLSDLILFANQLREWSETSVGVNDPAVFPLWEFCKSFVPRRFWGARLYGTRYQLYSNDPPISRLSPRKKEWVDVDTGSYLQWHNVTHNRINQSTVETSKRVIEFTRMGVRRVTTTADHRIPFFPQEV